MEFEILRFGIYTERYFSWLSCRIHEYIGDPQKGNFKPTEKIIDMPFQPRDDSYKVFEIEGIFNNPMSWIDWTIKAKRFKLKVKDII